MTSLAFLAYYARMGQQTLPGKERKEKGSTVFQCLSAQKYSVFHGGVVWSVHTRAGNLFFPDESVPVSLSLVTKWGL